MAFSPVTVSADLLLGWASLRSGAGTSTTTTSGGTKSGTAPVVKAPWENASTQTPASELVKQGLSGRAFFDTKKDFAVAGANADEKKLFALHAGLNTLAALAGRYDQKGVTTSEQARLTAAFDAGMKQLDAFLTGQKFDDLAILRGVKVKQATSTAGIGGTRSSYTTGVIARGSPDVENAAFAGDLSFHIDAKDISGNAKAVDIDLADMGATPRSLNNVVQFINSKLRASGLTSSFSAVKQGAVNGQDQYALKLSIAAGEAVNFSAGASAPAMYLASGANNMLKIADPAGGVAMTSQSAPNTAFNKAIAENSTIRATATGADGSVYVLADAKSVAGQPVKGAADVALYRYDSAGNLMYARTLGAASTASGFALAVSGDGKVAVTGSVSGALNDGTSTVSGSVIKNPQATDAATGDDAFVTLFDQDGVEAWTARERVVRDGENTAIAFGANGELYVGGRQTNAADDGDATLKTYSPEGVLRDTKTFATSADETPQAIVVQDLGGVQRVTMASLENGRAVLRQFDDSGLAVTAGTTRDLGPLGGGNIVGLKLAGGELYIGGNTKVGGIDVATAANTYGGGQDGFVAKLSADLTAGAGDRVTYIGGEGDDRIAGFDVSGGEVWYGGDSDKTFAGQAALRDRDGFAGRLDATGAMAWTQRFSAADGKFSAASFAVDTTGVTALDRLGLPQGDLFVKDVKDLVSGTSLRVGDQFSISVNGRTAQVIKIAEGDTMQKLVDKLNKALLSAGKASVSYASSGDGLRIAATGANRIEIKAGPVGLDALAGLGIDEGVVTPDAAVTSKNKKTDPIYGLGLSSSLSLADAASRAQVVTEIGSALAVIQKAFKTLITPESTTPQITGSAPAYLQKELANYQAALARLSG